MVIAVTAPARTIRCVFLGIGILQDCLYINLLSINNPDVDKHFRLSFASPKSNKTAVKRRLLKQYPY